VTPGRKALLLSGGAGAALSLLGTVPLMGLPGALALVPALPVIESIWGRAEFPEDSAWPWAIVTTLALGPVVPLAWMTTRRWRGWRQALAFAALFALGATAVAVATFAVAVAPMVSGGGSPAPGGLLGGP
jgi:hypothetical protein